MNDIGSYLSGKKKIAIAGHVSPDGDCIGSCLGLWNYLQDNYPEIEADVYMSKPAAHYDFLKGMDKIHTGCSKGDGKKYDLLVLMDISACDRIGVAGSMLEEVPETLCLDHHRTNNGSYTYFYNDPTASSACEVLCRHLDMKKISKECAQALYLGIVHDTGVFRYTSTSPETMRVAADLMEKGIECSWIIDETFYKKNFAQQKIQGFVMENSRLYLDGRFIVGTVSRKQREEMGVRSNEMDGIVSILRDTVGVETALFLHELDTGEIKASMRSTAIVDVSKICLCFGGGGHVRASGFKTSLGMEEIIEKVLPLVQEELQS